MHNSRGERMSSYDYEYNKAKSNQTDCSECYCTIMKDSFRLVQTRYHGSQYPTKRYWCAKHAIQQIKAEIEQLEVFEKDVIDSLKD